MSLLSYQQRQPQTDDDAEVVAPRQWTIIAGLGGGRNGRASWLFQETASGAMPRKLSAIEWLIECHSGPFHLDAVRFFVGLPVKRAQDMVSDDLR